MKVVYGCCIMALVGFVIVTEYSETLRVLYIGGQFCGSLSIPVRPTLFKKRQEMVSVHLFQTLHGKSRNLKEVEDACEVVRQNVDKLNRELKSKMDELENKKKQLKEVESRIQLSLRYDPKSVVIMLLRPAAISTNCRSLGILAFIVLYCCELHM